MSFAFQARPRCAIQEGSPLIAAVTGCADGYDDGEGAVCGRGLKLVHGLGWRLHLVIDRNGKTVRAARTIAA